jgi:AdoMet-dependent heme synthase
MASPYEQLQALSVNAGQPWSASLELTYRCNERCGMCYLGPDWGKGRKNDELTTAEWCALLDQLAEASVFDVLLTGGEVTLRSDFEQILDHAGSLGFKLTVKTNGTRVTPEFIEALLRNPVEKVDMSMLGSTAETNDAMTMIPGSFDKTLDAARRVIAAGFRVQLSFTAMSSNFREVTQARRLAKSLGAEFNWSAEVTPRDDRSIIPLKLRVEPEQLREVGQMHIAHAREDGEPETLSSYTDDGWFCTAGKSYFNVTPYGEIQPCINMRQDCGNVRDEPFIDIWHNSPYFKRIRALKVADVYGCNQCQIRDYCFACPGFFHMEMGDITMPSPWTCMQAEARQEAATGHYVACGARDSEGNLPRPAYVVAGAAGHQPIRLKARVPVVNEA